MIRHPRPSLRPGFTIIEMLFVFVLFAIVVRMGVRAMGTTLARDRTAKAAHTFASDIELAFATAARQRAPVRIRVDSVKRSYALQDATDTTVKYRERSFATGDLQVTSIKFTPWSFNVMPSGLATSTLTAVFTYGTGSTAYKKTVTMQRAGLVKIK